MADTIVKSIDFPEGNFIRLLLYTEPGGGFVYFHISEIQKVEFTPYKDKVPTTAGERIGNLTITLQSGEKYSISTTSNQAKTTTLSIMALRAAL